MSIRVLRPQSTAFFFVHLSSRKHSICLSHQAQLGFSFFQAVDWDQKKEAQLNRICNPGPIHVKKG